MHLDESFPTYGNAIVAVKRAQKVLKFPKCDLFDTTPKHGWPQPSGNKLSGDPD
jgi:hypothetical protein